MLSSRRDMKNVASGETLSRRKETPEAILDDPSAVSVTY